MNEAVQGRTHTERIRWQTSMRSNRRRGLPVSAPSGRWRVRCAAPVLRAAPRRHLRGRRPGRANGHRPPPSGGRQLRLHPHLRLHLRPKSSGRRARPRSLRTPHRRGCTDPRRCTAERRAPWGGHPSAPGDAIPSGCLDQSMAHRCRRRPGGTRHRGGHRTDRVLGRRLISSFPDSGQPPIHQRTVWPHATHDPNRRREAADDADDAIDHRPTAIDHRAIDISPCFDIDGGGGRSRRSTNHCLTEPGERLGGTEDHRHGRQLLELEWSDSGHVQR